MDQRTGGAGSDSCWCDAPATETISDLDGAESAAGHVHRISAYYACTIDDGSTVTSLGAPGLSRNGMSLADPVRESGDGGLLANFAANPLFSTAGPSRDDIDQGSVGDCYFVAALSAIAGTNPDVIRQTVADLGDGTYAVNFHGVFGTGVYVRVDADLWAGSGTLVRHRLPRKSGEELVHPPVPEIEVTEQSVDCLFQSLNALGPQGLRYRTIDAHLIGRVGQDNGELYCPSLSRSLAVSNNLSECRITDPTAVPLNVSVVLA